LTLSPSIPSIRPPIIFIRAIFFLFSESLNFSLETNLFSSFLIVVSLRKLEIRGKNSILFLEKVEERLLFMPSVFLFSVGLKMRYSRMGRIIFEIGLGKSALPAVDHSTIYCLRGPVIVSKVEHISFKPLNLLASERDPKSLK
jgi:hypothetical protein